MGDGRGRHHTVLGAGRSGGFRRDDPDRQVSLTVALAQQDDRLVGRHFDPDAQNIEFFHPSTVLDYWAASPALTKAVCKAMHSARI